ncbi:MAG: serine/threonine protein kinase, partial [Pseudomonadales bacterium]|nr:serine/threonine protein kinase [Pseudomonadales bacterium]
LQPEQVIAAVEQTGRRSDARVLALNSYENRVYQVGVEDADPVIVKFYRPRRWTAEQIREEHAFSRQLAEAELPIIAPLLDERGESLFSHAGFLYALFPRKGGQALEAGDFEQLLRIGRVLGRLHAVGSSQAFEHRATLTLQRWLDEPSACVLGSHLLPARWEAPYRQIILQLRQQIHAGGLESVKTIRTQGDCHPGNIIWTRDDGPWLLDFDDSQQAPAVQDLWMLLSGSEQEQRMQLLELLEGYTTFHDFDMKELALVETLRTLRMIHYAGWLANRWEDPAFPRYFPWFASESYWQEHIQELQVQSTRMEATALLM